MDVGYFRGSMILLTVIGITKGYTTAKDFQYTVCKWQNAKCRQQDPKDFIQGKVKTTSDWPKGPYALLTPNEGCPESFVKGWRRGYLSFTWKQPHTQMSATTCDRENTQSQSLNENVKEDMNTSDVSNCWRYLVPEFWPEIQSNLLGPFSKFAVRLNFCFKIKDENDATKDVHLWPTGSYSVFSDSKSCPSGFTHSERIIKLPAISSWTSYGFLPDYIVNTTEADNSASLTLKTCDRQTDNFIPNDVNNSSYFSADSFIFIKNNQTISCPRINGTIVVSEELKLRQDATDSRNFIDLFTICYYRPNKWFTDLDTYLYAPQDSLPYHTHQAFVILNPTLVYGNKTTSTGNPIFNELGTQSWSYGYQISVPWLLIDLGRNCIVVGLQFTKFFLVELDSTEYNGSLNSTMFGSPCQRWDVQMPHGHEMTEDDQFPDATVSDASNYCRNPSGDNSIWCYTLKPMIRWDLCADKVYKYQDEDRPFSQFFVTDNRWRVDEFGGMSCPYTVSYGPGILYFSLLKELEGRYVKLVGYTGTESSKFNSLVQNVEVLTSANIQYDERICNSDLGMGDESVDYFYITASSWLTQYPPNSVRPFFSGWCSESSEKNPYITVDMKKDTIIEGITVFNWEHIGEDIADGIYKKRYTPIGSKEIMVSFRSDMNKAESWTYINKTFNLDMFLPLEQPQTFVHSPVFARYITVYIIEAMTVNAKCLRFELHGCRQNGNSSINLPELLAVNWKWAGSELISFNNLYTLQNTSVLSSIDYPKHYQGGMSYTWIIDLPEGSFIQLLFTNTSFNTYGMDVLGQCRDTLKFLPGAYIEETMTIDQQFNGLVTLIDTSESYLSLTFTTCRPTSKFERVGYGFKLVINTQATSTCFVPGIKGKLQNYCRLPKMYITSVSRLNFPDSSLPEEWTINVKRFPIRLEILYFNVRCDTGSLLNITDRFSGINVFCNLRMVPSEMNSDSDTVYIRFVRGQNGIAADSRRKSAREGFKAVYKAVETSMGHLIYSQNSYRQDPQSENAPVLAHKACSKKFGKCYFIYSGSPSTWDTAGKECWIRQSRLVSIHSDEEQELINYLLRNFKYFGLDPETPKTAFPSNRFDPYYFTHIGLSRVTSVTGRHEHFWEDGSPVTFSAWNSNKPSSTGDCTRMSFHLFNTNNTWETENCKYGLAMYFICEHHLTQEMLSISSDRCNSTHSPYTGQWNRTQSGKTCQPWEAQYPHDHELFLDSQFPDGSVAEAYNYCRDPYSEGYLWCFTMDPATKSEPCVFEYKYQLGDGPYDYVLSSKTFECRNGEAILLQYLCNGIPDCRDLTDETNCIDAVHALMKSRTIPIAIPEMNPSYSLFQCESKEWISTLARCDGVIDCVDVTDEANCSHSLDVPGCSKDQYTCDDGGCIHISQMCDFIADCTDASDENCDYPLCLSTEYRCRNQQCIPVENRCDAFKHCIDGTDETDCDACQKAFHCDLVRCIPVRQVCDKYADCKDGSDESCSPPIHNSCEEWWKAGYRKSGIYKLTYDTEAECDFGAVHKDGNIFTIFNNVEVTAIYDVEIIHSLERELTELLNSSLVSTVDIFLQNDAYSCFQNITQSCIPAIKVAAEYEDLDHGNVYTQCDCLVMKVIPGYHAKSSKIYYCESDEPVTDTDRLLFHYQESLNKRSITLKDNFPKAMEITFGPVVCKHEGISDALDVGCGDGKVFPASVRCVYDRDQAGFILGCRSGEHLQGCETFPCPENTVKCPGSFCLPLKFICDRQIQCPGGQDEHGCGCEDDDREVLLLYEDRNNHEENQKMRNIAAQFYTSNSIVRELRYHLRTLPNKLDFDHRILDISDVEINPYSTIDRQFVCNYSILASDFMNSITFSKINSRGIIFFQERNNTGTLPKMMFSTLKTRPDFLIYRIMQDVYDFDNKPETFPFVQNIVVKRLTTLSTAGAKYFPGLCTEAANVYCSYEYRCSASKTCIPLEQVCDGHAQCAHGDDERSCGYSCPENCSCIEYTTDCSFANIDNITLTSLNKKSRLLDLSGNPGLQKALIASQWQFSYLISLNLSKCHIKEIFKNAFEELVNLHVLDLNFNKFLKIPASAFIGLRKLKHLYLFGNTEMYSLDPFSLNGLLSIRSLEIKGATIRRLSAHTFSGLHLEQLNLSHNRIMEMEDGVFSGLHVNVMDIEQNEIFTFNKGLFQGLSGITSLHAPAFKYCCIRPNYLAEENCFPQKDEFSSCDDLLRLTTLRSMLWLIGLLSLFGNILSIVYRLAYERDKLRLGYGIFVMNLAVADFLMGIYLIIIAIADAAFRKRYIFMDDFWRNSAWCTIAGFLSTVSSEASVFFLCLITLDRLFVIKYPFGQVRFGTKKSGIACLISWTVALSIGLIPVLYSGYFHGRFYSKSGVCIALPLTKDRPPGWLYSIIVFIGLNFITFCLIAVGQIILYSEIKKAASGIRHSSSSQGNSGLGRQRELRVARNLLFVVVTDFLCWFPIGCMGMMSLSDDLIPSDVYAWTAIFILPVNSALNPVLYTLMAILGKRGR